MSPNETEQSSQRVWRKASFCASTECIEVARRDGLIMVRDSAHPGGGTVQRTVKEWRTFVRDIKANGLQRRDACRAG